MYNNKWALLTTISAVITGVATPVFAIDPVSVRVSDGVMFTPTLQFEQRHDDNIFATKNDRMSSWVTVIEPTFTLSLDRAKSAHQLRYRMSSNNFHSSNRNSHINHHFTGITGFEFDVRNRLTLNAGYHKVQDITSDIAYESNRGSASKWHTKNIGGVYSFGARTALAQIDFGLDYQELRFDNNRRIDGKRINSNSERDTISSRVTGYYAVAPKVRLLLEGRYVDYNYKSASIRDNKNKALLAGVTWQAAAKTKGTVKVGRERKSYKNSFYKDSNNNIWEGSITWTPVSYSIINFNTRRGYDEGTTANYGSDGFFEDLYSIDSINRSIRTVDSQLRWQHHWKKHWYSVADYRHTDRKYQNENRDDKIDQYGIALTYEARRWLSVSLGYKYRNNDSSVKRAGYSRNIYSLIFTASL